MGQRPSFQRLVDFCFPQNGYAWFLAAFWSIRVSWRLGSWGGLCPRQWKVSFTVSVSQSTLSLPCLRYGGFRGMQVWFSKMTCLHLLGECGLIDLSSSASKNLIVLNIHSMRVCFLQYDLLGWFVLYL